MNGIPPHHPPVLCQLPDPLTVGGRTGAVDRHRLAPSVWFDGYVRYLPCTAHAREHGCWRTADACHTHTLARYLTATLHTRVLPAPDLPPRLPAFHTGCGQMDHLHCQQRTTPPPPQLTHLGWFARALVANPPAFTTTPRTTHPNPTRLPLPPSPPPRLRGCSRCRLVCTPAHARAVFAVMDGVDGIVPLHTTPTAPLLGI